jgi:hypothetical protein
MPSARAMRARRPLSARLLRITARGVREHQLVDPLGTGDRQPLADHAAHRQPDERGGVAAQLVEQPHGVVHQGVERERVCDHVALSVAACVVPNDGVPIGERRRDGVPHPEIAAERVTENEK